MPASSAPSWKVNILQSLGRRDTASITVLFNELSVEVARVDDKSAVCRKCYQCDAFTKTEVDRSRQELLHLVVRSAPGKITKKQWEFLSLET